MNKNIKVIGIDPKPSGNSHTIAFRPTKNLKNIKTPTKLKGTTKKQKDNHIIAELNHPQLSELITILTKDKSNRWLICWDAPLSIPSGENNFTIREIERRANDWKKNSISQIRKTAKKPTD